MRFITKVGFAASAMVMGIVGTASTGTTALAADTNQARRAQATFEVASFNILGSNHTVHSSRWASGAKRARWAARWLNNEGVTVTGMTEAQRDQIRALTARTAWKSYPNWRTSRDTQTAQSVAWRNDVFEKVKARTFTIPFHYGQQREQPVVLLRHRASGRKVWVVSVHLTSGDNPRAERERNVGTRRLINQVHRLEATGQPVIVTGDMNEHGEFFCDLAGATSLVTPVGGNILGGVCTPPWNPRIDWLFVSPRLATWGFRYADDAALDRITDHTVPLATIGLGY